MLDPTDGLREKFEVYRKSTGEYIDPEELFHFTLIPEHDDNARLALRLYALLVEDELPELSAALTAKLNALSL